MNPTYNTATIRRLLKAAFSDDEIRDLCYDYFREVYDKFAVNTPFVDKVQALVEYCERHNRFPTLLRLVEQVNPTQYAKFASTLQNSAPQPPTPDPRPLSRQPFEPEMILIPAGEFLMGSDPLINKNADDDEQPQHLLYLPDYYLAKTPVTNTQFLAFVKATGYQTSAEREGWGRVLTGKDEKIKGADWQHPGGPQSHIVGKYDYPVVQVSWHDAAAYCNWLAEITRKPYRLPSEAEWEKGARGTDGCIYPWGNEWDAKRCNSRQSGPGDTTSVGAYPAGASPYGLLDVAGNVWEWTCSLWGKDWQKPEFKYPYRPGDGRENLKAGDDAIRVVRGGSWSYDWVLPRCAARNGSLPGHRDNRYGFRVAMSPF